MIRAKKNRATGSGTPRNLPNGSVMKNMTYDGIQLYIHVPHKPRPFRLACACMHDMHARG